MRVIVMGTGPFAVPSAIGLLADGYDIPLVVTRPLALPVPKKIPSRPVLDWATSHGLKVFEPPSINTREAIEMLRNYCADLFFVCDYGQILSKDCLLATRLGGINLHGSILPRHRGAAPVQWTLLSGDSQAGVTVILMTPRLDAGPALTVKTTTILPDENAQQLESRLAELGVEATREAMRQLEKWDGISSIGQIQDGSLSTRAPRFEKRHGQLDFRLPAEYLARLIRACQPWPGTFADLHLSNSKRIRVLVRSARSVELPESTLESIFGSTVSMGAVTKVSSSQIGFDWGEEWLELFAVRTSKGCLLVNRIQPSGGREMAVREFVRGHPIASETHFVLPVDEPIRLTE